jgi:hypothetical protein
MWTTENKTQTQVDGGKEDLLHYWASPLDLSENDASPQLRAAGFLCFKMWKQASGKDKNRVSVSLSLGGYNISH